ncbi:MAG TPA: SusD/RagB family nutrient-binding outer membrane lipoprotein, partial [Puia sp.]
WVTTISLFDFVEGWSNWRRTNIPALTPVNYPGNFSGGTIPRRQVYPSTEAPQNPTNYSAAVGKLAGGDKFSGRVWWDK